MGLPGRHLVIGSLGPEEALHEILAWAGKQAGEGGAGHYWTTEAIREHSCWVGPYHHNPAKPTLQLGYSTPTITTLHNSWTTKHWRQHIAPSRRLLLELMVGQLQVSPEVPSTISWRLGDTPGRVARDSYGPITWPSYGPITSPTRGTHVPIAHPSQGTHVVPRHERVGIKRVTMVDIVDPIITRCRTAPTPTYSTI